MTDQAKRSRRLSSMTRAPLPQGDGNARPAFAGRVLGRPSDAPVVTGRVGPSHLTLTEIPSAGADPVTSAHKNLFLEIS